jgi:hypothetical protein
MSNVFLSGFDGTITASTYAVISSEFNAANTASWLTTSYLITSTAFQPLYGRFSDIFGRRVSFFTATITFMVGCLGCGIAKNIILLNVMRALTGIGGGGLMTMGMFSLSLDFSPSCYRKADYIRSYDCQLGSYPVPTPWHVPGLPKWHAWLWLGLRCIPWGFNRRYHWMALVLSDAGSCRIARTSHGPSGHSSS